MYKAKAFFDRYVAFHAMLRRQFVLAFLKMSRDKNLQDFVPRDPALPTIRHFENRRGEGPGDEVEAICFGKHKTLRKWLRERFFIFSFRWGL